MVNEVLQRKPGGEKIIQEYHKTKSLTDLTRRQLVNTLVADMVEVHGYVSRDFDSKITLRSPNTHPLIFATIISDGSLLRLYD